MKIFISVLSLFALALPAHAEIGFGVIGRYHISDQYTANNSDIPGESIAGQSGFSFGAMVFLPFAPLFSARLGFDIEQLKLASNPPGQDGSNTTTQNLLVPLDVQFDILESRFYVYAGAVLVATLAHSTQSPPGTTGGGYNTRPDARFDFGAGYNFVTLGPVKLAAELEYMKGLFNISPNPDGSIRTQSLNANLLARFSF